MLYNVVNYAILIAGFVFKRHSSFFIVDCSRF